MVILISSLIMRTSIIEDVDLPDERRDALSREAMRRGVPVDQLVRECLLEKADQLIEAAKSTQILPKKAA